MVHLEEAACADQHHAHALATEMSRAHATENIWQFMRDNWLSNHVFKSGDDFVVHCCAAWNKLIDQPWRVMSIGLRDWAHES